MASIRGTIRIFLWNPSMPISADPLFKPFSVGKLKLANRIVMAPMTRSFSPEGVPGADVAAYYRRRAENQVGLIITEGTVINHPASTNDPRVPHFYGDAALAGWAKVLAEVHAAGGRIMPQIWHVGTVRKMGDRPNPEAPPIGPSGLYKPGVKVTEPMTEAEIAAVIAAYAQAAADARRLGFDGVELHGAHGYLIDQFFWEGTNQRTDRYGGDMVARTRFAVEVIQACRRAVGPDFPIVLRFSQWKQQDYAARLATTPELLGRFLAPLVDAGVDLLHCSTRRFWEPEFEGSPLNLAGWTKKLTGKPVITVGSVSLDTDMFAAFRGQGAAITSIDKLIEMIAREEVDLVAVGRAVLVDPAWAAKVHDNRLQELLPFTPESLRSLS
jgi:2,4-dienoyl-CoA reductase-like NADH-dependent reductase (Old Yellow Enzyme family)